MLYEPVNEKEPSDNQQLVIGEEDDKGLGCLTCLEVLAIFSGVIMFWLYLVS